MKRTVVFLVVVLGVSLSSSFAAGFVWDPYESSYTRTAINPLTGSPYPPTRFNAIDPIVAAFAGLGTGEGYGTAGFIGDDFDVAYGGPAPASLIPQGINEREGHFYFGFANTFPTTNNFSAYELGNTRLKSDTSISLRFLRQTDDPINFIGICGDPTAGEVTVNDYSFMGEDILGISITMTNPVFSTKGQGDQDSVFGLYINYGSYDADNVGVDYDGAVFRTNIHWWDIDVPAISEAKLASIQLSTSANTDAVVTATVPDSYFAREGIDPNDVRGYIDSVEIPLGQGLSNETYSFAKVAAESHIDGEDVSEYVIHSDQWSTHDIGVGVVPEPATLSLLALGGVALLRRRRK